MEPEHANDPDNQDTSNVSSDPQTQVPEKPPRSKLERSIVWSVIGLLLVLTGMEGLAQYGYRKTLTNLETAIAETKKPLTLEDFNGEIRKGLPIVTSGVREGGRKRSSTNGLASSSSMSCI